jgi:hypothetical protein
MIAMRHEQSGTSLRLTLTVCAALLALPVAASAQQAQDDEDTFEQKIIKNILGGLGVDVGRPGIDYRERSPLVIPPTRDLPPPQASNASAINPAWPRDQEQRKLTVSNKPNARATPDEPGSHSVLSPDELRRGTNPRAGRVTDPSQSTGSLDEANIGRPMSPSQLNASSIFTWGALTGKHQGQATFTNEPTRGSLTQPPVGYQTPSPNYPYGFAGDAGAGWKLPSILDRPVGFEQ